MILDHNELVRKGVMDCAVAEDMVANKVDWRKRIHKVDPKQMGYDFDNDRMIGTI